MQKAIGPRLESVHAFGVNVLVPLVFQATVPEGVMGVPDAVSITIAKHCVDFLPVTEAAKQLTMVEVVRFVTFRLDMPELAEWLPSPL
jgi:hypothetical protein